MPAHKSSYEVVITFGKYVGSSLGYIHDINPNYLEWLSTANGLPEKWAIAAALTLAGESVEHLDIKKTIYEPESISCEIWPLKKDKLGIKFSYDAELLSRFKIEIDGRKWNKKEKYWEIPSVQLPNIVKLFGTKNITTTDDIKELYKKLKTRRKELDEIRVRKESDFKVEGLLLPARGYQNVAVEFFLRANGRVLCADQMGVGKTFESIAFAKHTNSKTLIICPKSVIINWEREIKKFLGKLSCVWEADGRRGKKSNQFHIINYDIVEKNLDDLLEQEFDLLICDEATMLKNRKTRRTKSVFGDGKNKKEYPGIKTKYVIFLTGTPVMNRPVEAFTLLNFIDQQRFNSFFHFIQKYGGWKGEPPRNLDDLHHRVQDVFIRRRTIEVQPELPNKQRENIYVELSKSEVKDYNKMLDDLFRKWRKLGKPSVAEMPAIQIFLFYRKKSRVIEIIDELLDNDKSVLVYSSFIEPLQELQNHYGDKLAIMFHGGIKLQERQNIIDDLAQKKKKIGLFSINAGGLGIDSLQYAISDVIFLDRWWVPAIHEQAEARTHRSGQLNTVNAYYITCVNTIDEYMADILTEKQKIADQIVDGGLITPAASKSYFKEFVRRLRKDSSSKMFENIDSEVIIDISEK